MPALAEKYRQSSWDEVIGQENVIARLHKLAERGTQAGRAFWLSGQSGTGKTTIARLIAQEVADSFNITELDAATLNVSDLVEIPIIVTLIVNRMLADPRLFTHVGNPSLELSNLPVFGGFSSYATDLAPAGIQFIYPRDPSRKKYAGHLCNLIFDFLAAHELSHHTHGHTGYDAEEYGRPYFNEWRFLPGTPVYNRESQAIEMDADFTASLPLILMVKRIVDEREKLEPPL